MPTITPANQMPLGRRLAVGAIAAGALGGEVADLATAACSADSAGGCAETHSWPSCRYHRPVSAPIIQ